MSTPTWQCSIDADAIWTAVRRAFAAVEDPGAEIWTHNDAYFANRARPLIVHHWCEITQLHPEQMPFQDHFLRSLWTAWRKTNRVRRQGEEPPTPRAQGDLF